MTSRMEGGTGLREMEDHSWRYRILEKLGHDNDLVDYSPNPIEGIQTKSHNTVTQDTPDTRIQVSDTGHPDP